MDVFVLGNDYLNSFMLDGFESLIWTERYCDLGEFELYLNPNEPVPFAIDSRIMISNSDRIMIAENIDRPANGLIKVSGKSIESFMQYRSNRLHLLKDPESATGTIPQLGRFFVHKYMVDPATAGTTNWMPNLTAPVPSSAGTSYTVAVPRGDILGIVKSLAESEDCGFKIVMRTPGNMVFAIYRGADRSSSTGTVYIEYSEDLENFTNISVLDSNQTYKNHARVLGARAAVDVYPPGVNGSALSGWGRRTIVVEAQDIGTDSGVPVANDTPLLQRRGMAALLDPENMKTTAIDGDVLPDQSYSQVLGEIVAVMDRDRKKVKKRVTELVRTYDKTGYRVIPTFEQVY